MLHRTAFGLGLAFRGLEPPNYVRSLVHLPLQFHDSRTGPIPSTVCFIAMIPLQKIFDWGGDEISAFLDEDLRDLLVITLSKSVSSSSIVAVKYELTIGGYHQRC